MKQFISSQNSRGLEITFIKGAGGRDFDGACCFCFKMSPAVFKLQLHKCTTLCAPWSNKLKGRQVAIETTSGQACDTVKRKQWLQNQQCLNHKNRWNAEESLHLRKGKCLRIRQWAAHQRFILWQIGPFRLCYKASKHRPKFICKVHRGLEWKERNAFQGIESAWWSQLINGEKKAHNPLSRDWKHLRRGHKKREKEQWDWWNGTRE